MGYVFVVGSKVQSFPENKVWIPPGVFMDAIPAASPAIGDEEIATVAGVMRSGAIASGPVVTRFEEAFTGTVEPTTALAWRTGRKTSSAPPYRPEVPEA